MLRLTASDGSLQSSDVLSVTATGGELRIDSVDFPAGWSQGLRVKFTASADASYTVQFKQNLASGSWTKLQDVSAQPQPRIVEVYDLAATNSAARYYRLVSPALP